MTDLVDISKAIVQAIDREIKVLDIQLPKVFVCTTKYITECKIVTDSSGNKYTVDKFEQDDWLELTPISPAPAFNDTVIFAPEVKFLHGTPTSVNNEYLAMESRQLKKTPFVWLLETYTEDSLELDSSIEAAYNARFFFMEGAVDEQSNDKIHTNAIKPMKALTEGFLDVIRGDFKFKTLSDIARTPRPRFGVEVLNRGSDRKILDAGLSGYDMRLKLEVYDVTLCKNNC